VTSELNESDDKARRRRMREGWDAAQADLIYEITAAAAKIAAAKHPSGDPSGEPVFRTDAVSALLSAIARSHYCCCLADVGRLMDISRQQAQRLAREAERRQLVELARNPDDRRIVQVLLTADGRSAIERARRDGKTWAATLLLGLDMPRLVTATHVVRVIRQRLARAEREGRQALANHHSRGR
jgi:DNA-binding MarR family transcriptional regulator